MRISQIILPEGIKENKKLVRRKDAKQTEGRKERIREKRCEADRQKACVKGKRDKNQNLDEKYLKMESKPEAAIPPDSWELCFNISSCSRIS
jgi:hypothetical protein